MALIGFWWFLSINERDTLKPIDAMDNLFNIIVDIQDLTTRQTQQYQFRHTHHSLERASQRSIGKEQLALALAYGETYHKQGLIFYVLGEKKLPAALCRKINARNIVVVVNGDSGQILTCYRNPDPHKYIRLKTKRLTHWPT
ncbi:hypothetical protein [Spirosoma fluviale]|uniref:DUF4258 domain-containing protein n=1 Tax=Spirosoma fluviale TaxID=1597977 RepID=A0A286GLP0_9BACT|nr:hypothetical protein [Spirosoma fluviale]SOD96430.1 hypothetical protein SAMN06269250_5305 [Spirosoma fluviale]